MPPEAALRPGYAINSGCVFAYHELIRLNSDGEELLDTQISQEQAEQIQSQKKQIIGTVLI